MTIIAVRYDTTLTSPTRTVVVSLIGEPGGEWAVEAVYRSKAPMGEAAARRLSRDIVTSLIASGCDVRSVERVDHDD